MALEWLLDIIAKCQKSKTPRTLLEDGFPDPVVREEGILILVGACCQLALLGMLEILRGCSTRAVAYRPVDG